MKRAVSLAIFAAFLACALPLHAEDEFNTAVHRLSDKIGRRPMRIPFLGAILFFTPARSTHLKLATWENVNARLSLEDLEASLQGTLGSEWHPFVKVNSRKNHECTLIYARAVGDDMRLMVIDAEPNEVNVIEMDLTKKLQELWLADARQEAKHHNYTGDEKHDGA